MENPDIIQLGSLIRDSSQLGSSSVYHSQTGLDIGDDTPAPGADVSSRNGSKTNPVSKFTLDDKTRFVITFVGGIITGGFIGSILTMGRRRR